MQHIWQDVLTDNQVDRINEEVMKILTEVGVNFEYQPAVDMLKAHGCRLTLGTDGASSNNNNDMIDEMNAAALLAKLNFGPDKLSASEAFKMATEDGAAAFGMNGGKIEEGRLADAMLVRLDNHRMVPDYNIISNLVYSASSEVIDTLICDGKVIMRNRKVDGEEEILARVAERCKN